MALDRLSISFSNLHHAYLIEGGESALSELCELLGEQGIVVDSNPDVMIERFETFTVDDSRRIKERQIERSFSGGKRFFILYMLTPTREAGQALLKVLEEPAPNVHFFIITPRASLFPPTVFSRVVVVKSAREVDKKTQSSALEFLKSDEPDRLDFVKKMIARHSKDETGEPLKQEAIFLLNHIEEAYAKDIRENKKLNGDNSFVEQLFICKKYLLDKGSSVKILLEHLALVLPRI